MVCMGVRIGFRHGLDAKFYGLQHGNETAIFSIRNIPCWNKKM